MFSWVMGKVGGSRVFSRIWQCQVPTSLGFLSAEAAESHTGGACYPKSLSTS